MGIQGLWSYLTKNHYDAFVSLSDDLSPFKGQTWAIDVSIYMYKFGTRDSFVTEFLEQATKLQAFGIIPVYIFDGKRHPVKRYEHMRRREQALRSVENIMHRQELLRRLDSDPNADVETIRSWVSELGNVEVQKTVNQQAILHVDGMDGIELDLNSEQLAAAVREREPKPQIKIPDAHYEILMCAFESAHIPFIIATGDAEKCGAYMCRINQAQALVTDDGDALVFGAPVVVRNLFRGGKSGMELVRVPDLLQKMELTTEQFIDMAIICGCDYTECRGLPGVGPAKAIKLLKTHGSLKLYLQSLEWIARQTMLNFDMNRLQFEEAAVMFTDDSNQVLYSSQAINPAAVSVRHLQ
jgi:5'-3' exonuclease